MFLMARFGGVRGVLVRATLCGLVCQIGCSRQIGVPTEEGMGQTSQAPFQDDARAGNPSGGPLPAADEDPDSVNHLPFHEIQSLPAGTLIMVRLKTSILAEKLASQDSFEAAMDAPVIAAGATIIPRGADVTGRIQSARISQMRPGRGYVQLALQSVRMDGVDVPVQTASLFVRQSPQNDRSTAVMKLEKGRRLTFRLIQPVYASNQTSQTLR